ncbi:MAG: carboxymuconolactone decarboxylase family protein [Planctomycetota bacterium]|jgi:4-carboxymuconolactone decarboxylase
MRIERLARIVAAAAVGRTDELPRLYREAHDAGISPADLAEATLQVFLFAGYPRTIVAFQALQAVAPGTPPLEPDRQDFTERGRAIFEEVYGKHAETVLEMLAGLHPDFARYVIHDAYGQVLGRPFLPLVERELLAVAMLAALELPDQLKAHVRGARAAGATEDQIGLVLAQ